MARGPEDPLARMARWDELRRRLDDAAPAGDPPPATADDPPQAGAYSGYRVDESGYRVWDVPLTDERPASALHELATAVRKVVEQHPSGSITITIQGPAGTSSVRVSHNGDQLTVTATDASSPPGSEPADRGQHHAEDPEQSGSQAIAELAELLRQNPSLLSRRHWAERSRASE